MASEQDYSDPLAIFNNRVQRMVRPQTNVAFTAASGGRWKCKIILITTSGQRYEGSGVSFRRREAKREAARDVLALIPQPAVTPTDTQSMIAALRNDGHELHLTGKSLSIKTTEIIWSLELHVTGNSSFVFGSVSGKRETAISYVLEDACVHFGYLVTRRIERNVKPKEKKCDALVDDKTSYSSEVIREFKARYTGDITSPGPVEPLLMHPEDIRSKADQIRFLQAHTKSFDFEIESHGARINKLWEFRVKVNGETNPIGTAGPDTYKSSKKIAIAAAVSALGQRRERKRGMPEEEGVVEKGVGKRARL